MQNQKNNMVDQFGRVHDYLRISLTERCNLRCFYCMPEEGIPLREKSEFMTTEETLFIAKTFVNMGVKKIRLTGGEPLIKKNIAQILHELSKLPVELAITTNGILVDQYLEDFKKAGMRSVNVSLDSLNEQSFEKISRRNYFSRIINNIDLLIQNGFNTKVNVVVMRGVNDHEIFDFVNWTKDKNVQVRFIEFMPFDGNKWNWDKKVSYKEMIESLQLYFGEDQIEALPSKQNDTCKNFKLKNARGNFGIIASVTNPFCDTCNRIRLTADGKIKNCLFSQTETDLLAAHRRNEALESLILESIFNKKKARGGVETFEDPIALKLLAANRTMTTIGG